MKNVFGEELLRENEEYCLIRYYLKKVWNFELIEKSTGMVKHEFAKNKDLFDIEIKDFLRFSKMLKVEWQKVYKENYTFKEFNRND